MLVGSDVILRATEPREYRILQVYSILGMGRAETWLMALIRYLYRIKSYLPFREQIDICLTEGGKRVLDDETI